MTSPSDYLWGPALRRHSAGVVHGSGASSQRAASGLLWVTHAADRPPLSTLTACEAALMPLVGRGPPSRLTTSRGAALRAGVGG